MAGRVHGFVSKCSLRGYRNLRRCAPCAKRGDQAEGSSSMEFQDKVLKCIDCGADFVFTAGEQLFFHDKAFRNEPKRCKACKAKRVAVLGAVPSGNHRGGFGKDENRTPCSHCGKETTAPFRPTQGRPGFFRECFQQQRGGGSGRFEFFWFYRGALAPPHFV